MNRLEMIELFKTTQLVLSAQLVLGRDVSVAEADRNRQAIIRLEEIIKELEKEVDLK